MIFLSISLSKKKDIVKKIKEIAINAKSIILTDYKGLSAPEVTDLRLEARKKDVSLFVAKNRLLKIGFKKTDYANMETYLKGQILLFFSKNEISSSAKIVEEFHKKNDKLKVTLISLSGKNYSGKDLKYISSLPTKKESLCALLFVLKTPNNNLLNTLRYPKLRLLILLKELINKKTKNQ